VAEKKTLGHSIHKEMEAQTPDTDSDPDQDLAFKINDRLPTMHKEESQKVWSRLCYLAEKAYAQMGDGIPWIL